MACLHDDVLTKVLITVHASGEKLLWLLVVVEWFTLHDDIFTKILITVHAGGEEFLGSWLLIIMEWLSLHNNVLAKIFITVHAGSEVLVVWNARKTSSIDSRLRAGAKLEESSSSSNSLIVGENFLRRWAIW